MSACLLALAVAPLADTQSPQLPRRKGNDVMSQMFCYTLPMSRAFPSILNLVSDSDAEVAKGEFLNTCSQSASSLSGLVPQVDPWSSWGQAGHLSLSLSLSLSPQLAWASS